MSYMRAIPIVAVLLALGAAACSSDSGSGTPARTASGASAPAAQRTVAPAIETLPTASATTAPAPGSEVEEQEQSEAEQVAPTPFNTPTSVPRPPRAPDLGFSFSTRGWTTDFSIHSVPFAEIKSGGPPRDGIQPIDDPRFLDVASPPEYMSGNEPVVSLEINGDARAYPLAILVRHEIVNDEVGGVPVTVTYCPLCNTAIVFDRTVNGEIFTFGTSGNLRNSDLIMWDRQTQSWWQQITGEAIVGELTGTKLRFIPSTLVSWKQFREAFPDGMLLSRETLFYAQRTYDSAPYSGYDAPGSTPFLFFDEIDPRLQAMERVVTVSIDDKHVAYPFLLLEKYPTVNDSISGTDIVVFYVGGTASPFGGTRVEPRQVVGSTAVYGPTVDGRKLTFQIRDNVIVDAETGSSWNILGQAVDGELMSSQLKTVVHGNHFWFAWTAFHPDTAVRTAADLGG